METELRKCLLCKNPFCKKGCPSETDIARVNSLLRGGGIIEAGRILFENNPFSAITGAICPNYRFCAKSCVLAKMGKGVNFSKIERQVSKQFLGNANGADFAPKVLNGKSVCIIGGGPAGLSAAFFLRRKGFEVSVYEREQKLGGCLRYGIPDVRLDKSLIDKIVKILEEMGVVFNYPVTAGAVPPLPEKGNYIVVAAGAGVSKKLGIEGEDDNNIVIGALEYLKNPADGNVIIIGGGNVAVDCSIATQMAGGRATVCYRRGEADMRAGPHEISLARDLGAQFRFNMIPKRIAENGAVFTFDDGEIFCPADKVVIAVGQSADNSRFTAPNTEFIGDAAAGSTTTVTEAVASAKKLAEKLASNIMI